MTYLDFPPSPTEIFTHPSVAKVVSLERQSLRVAWMASTWPAEIYTPSGGNAVTPGQTVKVCGRKGITLLIST
jgi:membrane protein implicated in regulation of membrane protease activity